MPATLCCTLTNSDEKKAWDTLNEAEGKIEALLLQKPKDTLAISDTYYYFIHNGRMYSTTEPNTGLSNAFTRFDYEGLGVIEMNQITWSANRWLENPIYEQI